MKNSLWRRWAEERIEGTIQELESAAVEFTQTNLFQLQPGDELSEGRMGEGGSGVLEAKGGNACEGDEARRQTCQ